MARQKAIVARGGRLAVFSADEISEAGRREVEAAGDGEAGVLHQDITATGAAAAMADEITGAITGSWGCWANPAVIEGAGGAGR